MVALQDSSSHPHPNANITATCAQPQPYYYYAPPPSNARINRAVGRSMRTIRSNIFNGGLSGPILEQSPNVSENLTDSVIDLQLGELANKSSGDSKSLSCPEIDDALEISRAFSDFSSCSSDISGELQRLAHVPDPGLSMCPSSDPEPEPCSGFLQRETFSTEIIESISPEDLQPTVKLCVDGLRSPSIAVKRSAAAKLRLLAKNRADNRVLIGESGAVPALIPLLRCSDPMTQEHSVTALLNLSLHENNKRVITNAGAIKSFIYVLKTGSENSKQNAACALLSLALEDEYKLSIGASGAISPLVSLLINGSSRGKKDALTTLYKLCSIRLNKERAVSAGAVRPLVPLVLEQDTGLAEKALVVLSSLAGIEMGRDAIIEEGGIAALVETIEDGSSKGKEFAVLTLLQLCAESVRNRGLLVREGGIPPLVALSQTGTAKAKHKQEKQGWHWTLICVHHRLDDYQLFTKKAETLLGYLREPRHEASSSSP